MSNNPTGSQKTYSTGELAAECGVSVRTVQFYDEKGLLPPTDLTEGGRRIYTEDDAAKLRKILLLKSLGLKLDVIQGILDSDVSSQILIDILREQDARLQREVEDKQAARSTIAAMIDGLEATGELPTQTTTDMESIMANVKWYNSELRSTYFKLLAFGLTCAPFEVGSIVWWIVTGNWQPFVIVYVIVAIACVPIVRMYRRHTAYICPHCHEVFVPRLREWFFANHTPTTRKVTCVHCNEKDFCTEVSAERLHAHA